MVYTVEQANRIASQLERLTSGYAHHVAGQHANLEFWLGEAEHALAAIEGYKARFERLKQAQVAWVESHNTVVGSYCPICKGACELEPKFSKPEPPKRIKPAELGAARRRLRDAAYHFLLRCYRMEFVDEREVRAACERLGTSVEPGCFAR